MLGCVEFQTRRSKALFQTLFIFCVWRSGRTLCAETIGTPLVSVFFFCVRPQLRGEQFFRERANTTQRCNIVATLFGMVTTLPQHCNAVLRWKSSLRIVACNMTFKRASRKKVTPLLKATMLAHTLIVSPWPRWCGWTSLSVYIKKRWPG